MDTLGLGTSAPTQVSLVSFGGYSQQDDPTNDTSGGFWSTYYYLIVISTVLQGISVCGIVVVWWNVLCRCWRNIRKSYKRVEERVAVIVPCYLPNEAPIIEGTLRHLLQGLEDLDSVDVHMVYNTPKDMQEVENMLAAMAREELPAGRRLFVNRVHGSTSKAQNLNFAIQRMKNEQTVYHAPYTAIYDADHHPDPSCLALAVNHLKETAVDCVQGSTYIREGPLLWRVFVNAEFFVTYFLMLPIMQAITGTGFFGGANAVWATTSLQRITGLFDHQALCEDIDCFARAFTQHGLKFTFLPEACSGELLPAGVRAFWKQRLRWAMGWDQVTARNVGTFLKAKVGIRSKIGLYYIFVLRWFSQFCGIIVILVNARAAIDKWLNGGSDVGFIAPPYVGAVQYCSFLLYCSVIFSAFGRALMHSIYLVPGVALYFSVFPVYVMFTTFTLMVSLTRIVSGKTGDWVVTARRGTAAPLIEPELPALDKTSYQISSTAKMWLASGFVAQGAAAGTLVGYFFAQTPKQVPSICGYIPGLPWVCSGQNTYVTDGTVVVEGLLSGLCLSLLVILIVLRAELAHMISLAGSCTKKQEEKEEKANKPPEAAEGYQDASVQNEQAESPEHRHDEPEQEHHPDGKGEFPRHEDMSRSTSEGEPAVELVNDNV